jgi:hypothetical protein
MEIDGGVLEVGPPINILQIAKHGAKWIQKKAEKPSKRSIHLQEDLHLAIPRPH